MAWYWIKGYHLLITGSKKIQKDEADKTKDKNSALKLLNFTSCSELMLTQEDTVWFKIVRETKKKINKHRDARQTQIKLSRKFHPTKGAFKTKLWKKVARYKLDGVQINAEEWINKIKLLREDIQKLDVHIDIS